MKPTHVMYGCLVAMLLAVGATLFVPRIDNGQGYKHPAFPEIMQRGTTDPPRHEQLWAPAAIFGAAQIVFFLACLAFGASRRKRLPKTFLAFLGLGGAAYMGVFVWMFEAYLRDPGMTSSPFFGGFPLPTAIMLYGVWGIPLVFVVLYVAFFKRFIFTAEDEVAFRELVARQPESRPPMEP
jgi:hypothetical protein